MQLLPGNVYLILDTTLCPIQVDRSDWNYQKLYFSKKHGHHGLKYEIGVSANGKIFWIAGGVPGSTHDLTLVRMSGLLEVLEAEEKIYADKG